MLWRLSVGERKLLGFCDGMELGLDVFVIGRLFVCLGLFGDGTIRCVRWGGERAEECGGGWLSCLLGGLRDGRWTEGKREGDDEFRNRAHVLWLRGLKGAFLGANRGQIKWLRCILNSGYWS